MPWTTFAMRPSGVAQLLNEVVIHRCQTIIECGIGVSTLHLLSDSLGCRTRVIGIDEDANWIKTIEGYLNRMGVSSDRYTFICAPMKSCFEEDIGRIWYDRDVVCSEISAVLKQDKADLLLVDGPKGNAGSLSRYLALPTLHQFLADDYSIFLDDIDRPDERFIAHEWAATFKLNVHVHSDRGGVAILRPETTRRSYTIT